MNDWDPARERSRARSTRPAPVTVERGCEVALADMKDAEALTAAFTGVSGVFVLIPSNFDPTPGFPEVRAIITALTTAMKAYRPTFCQGRHPLCHCKRPGHRPAYPPEGRLEDRTLGWPRASLPRRLWWRLRRRPPSWARKPHLAKVSTSLPPNWKPSIRRHFLHFARHWHATVIPW